MWERQTEDARTGAPVQFLALAQPEMGLKQSLGQQHKQSRIDHQRESAGIDVREIPKTFVLPVPLFDGGAQFIR